MSTTTLPSPAAAVGRRAQIALLLALLGVLGCTLAWDLPAGGFWIGMPLAFAALALGVGVLRHPEAERGARQTALAAVALAAIEILFTAAWTIAG